MAELLTLGLTPETLLRLAALFVMVVGVKSLLEDMKTPAGGLLGVPVDIGLIICGVLMLID